MFFRTEENRATNVVTSCLFGKEVSGNHMLRKVELKGSVAKDLEMTKANMLLMIAFF